MKKIIYLLLIASITMCTTKNNGKIFLSTVEGVAGESKAGLVVDGVVLMSIPYEKIEFYKGKYLRVTGVVEKGHPWKIDPGSKIHKTGFSLPVMIKIKSIKVLKKE